MALVEALMSKLLRPPRILLAEDDYTVGNLFLVNIRDQYECDIDWVIDGERAIDFVGEKPYDVVFLDLSLPIKSGIEVLRYIKEEKPTLPVIVVAERAEATGCMDGANLGVVGFLSKPLSSVNFANIFRTYGIRAIPRREYAVALEPQPA
jgi:DNA-binding response OmpR family regulator